MDIISSIASFGSAFRCAPWTSLARSSFSAGWPPALLVLVYVFLVHAWPACGAPTVSSSTGRSRLRNLLLSWNVILAIFSVCGVITTLPALVMIIARKGLHASVCAPAELSYGDGRVGLWVLLFILSKPMEMLDTAFLLAAGKRVSLLHWYHHASVAAFTWHAYGTRSSLGLWFAAVNFFAHALLYSYYAAAAAGFRFPWPAAVTLFQVRLVCVCTHGAAPGCAKVMVATSPPPNVLPLTVTDFANGSRVCALCTGGRLPRTRRGLRSRDQQLACR